MRTDAETIYTLEAANLGMVGRGWFTFMECAMPRILFTMPSSVRLIGGSSRMTGSFTMISPPPCSPTSTRA